MKRHLTLLWVTLLTMYAYGAHVLPNEAAEKARQFLEFKSGKKLTIKSIKAYDNNASCYVVTFSPEGWVIVSGEDVIEPIVGYNPKGNVSSTIMPDNMKEFMDAYTHQIKHLSQTTARKHFQWSNDFDYSRTVTRDASKTAIEPLITVNWGQSSPYNKYCPKKDTEPTAVGCVAVAMGQAMSVQRWPSKAKSKASYSCPGYGYLSVDYDKERAYNWDDILSGTNGNDEVARLLYHAGVSVSMQYGNEEEGSGVPTSRASSSIANALKDIFAYGSNVTYYNSTSYPGDWNQLLINELMAGRAIIYNGVDTKNEAGHCFNIDGYDGAGLFHVNWGWSGRFNGYFPITHLYADGKNYDSHHSAVVGIGAGNQPIKSIGLSNFNIEEGLDAGAVVAQITVDNALPRQSQHLTVTGSGNSTVPFIIDNGILKTTETLNASTKYNIEITVEDTELKASLTQGFTINVTPWQSVEQATSISFNRESRVLTIKTKHNVSYELKDAGGNFIISGDLDPLPRCDIPMGNYPSGQYTLLLSCGNDVKQMTIINK